MSLKRSLRAIERRAYYCVYSNFSPRIRVSRDVSREKQPIVRDRCVTYVPTFVQKAHSPFSILFYYPLKIDGEEEASQRVSRYTFIERRIGDADQRRADSARRDASLDKPFNCSRDLHAIHLRRFRAVISRAWDVSSGPSAQQFRQDDVLVSLACSLSRRRANKSFPTTMTTTTQASIKERVARRVGETV